MKNQKRFNPIVILLFIISACTTSTYQGKPFTDQVYTKGIQTIPGHLECEYFDLGGEGISYHDTDSTNSGSGALNPVDGSYLHEFRIHEAVDISYVKFSDQAIDNNPFNFVEPIENQLYVGWTEPGEWLKYTVDVKKTGTYQLGLMYTSNQDGAISISVNDADITGEIFIPNTYVAEDSLAWRQWHHWNYLGNMARVELKEGIQVLTLHTIDIGQMNYEHIDFTLIEE